MFLFVLIASALAACSHKNFSPCSSGSTSPSHDLMLHVQTWPGYFCSSHCCDMPTALGEMRSGFTMHGWWPEYFSGYPSCCKNSYNTTYLKKVIDNDQQLKEDIAYNWPSLTKCLFVEYEYMKHGTCISDIYGGADGPKDYMNSAIYLLNKYDLWKVFQNAGVIADGSTKYSKDMLSKAVQEAYGTDSAVFMCSGSKLSEIRLCSNVDSDDKYNPYFIDCPTSIKNGESCGSTIVFEEEPNLSPYGCEY
ncbi:Ribonuclease [Entamoeba marina]